MASRTPEPPPRERIVGRPVHLRALSSRDAELEQVEVEIHLESVDVRRHRLDPPGRRWPTEEDPWVIGLEGCTASAARSSWRGDRSRSTSEQGRSPRRRYHRASVVTPLIVATSIPAAARRVTHSSSTAQTRSMCLHVEVVLGEFGFQLGLGQVSASPRPQQPGQTMLVGEGHQARIDRGAGHVTAGGEFGQQRRQASGRPCIADAIHFRSPQVPSARRWRCSASNPSSGRDTLACEVCGTMSSSARRAIRLTHSSLPWVTSGADRRRTISIDTS